MTKYTFTGHETFYCRHYWLKKGFDFVKKGYSFNSADAVTKLGVGKNMVNSIRFWLKSFGINLNEDNNFSIGNFLFSEENGKDKYLEDINSLWLLHYYLVTEKVASIYSLFFHHIRIGEKEFTDEKIAKGINFYLSRFEHNLPNEKSLNADVKVLRANYLPPIKYKNLEDDFAGLLQDLGLFQPIDAKKFKVENIQRKNLNADILMFAILDLLDRQKESSNLERRRTSVSIDQLLSADKLNVSMTFCLNEQGLLDKIHEIESDPFYNERVIYKENSGIRELQINNDLEKEDILNKYYNGVK